jgi:beta-phosphoglucomutase-like phosphatase (HAD superfamily)
VTFAAVIFDFDGVILESVDIKTRAFLELFAEYPEHHAAIRRLHEENGGMSRYEKFRRIHAELLHRPLADDAVMALGDRFGAIVAREILRCPFVAGAESFVRRVSATVPCHIASGTPEAELQEIVAARGLAGYFDLVLGSPTPKPLATKPSKRPKRISPGFACRPARNSVSADSAWPAASQASASRSRAAT